MTDVQEFEVWIRIRDESGRIYQIHTIEDFDIEPLDTDAPEMTKPYEIVETQVVQGYRMLRAVGCNGVLVNLDPRRPSQASRKPA